MSTVAASLEVREREQTTCKTKHQTPASPTPLLMYRRMDVQRINPAGSESTVTMYEEPERGHDRNQHQLSLTLNAVCRALVSVLIPGPRRNRNMRQVVDCRQSTRGAFPAGPFDIWISHGRNRRQGVCVGVYAMDEGLTITMSKSLINDQQHLHIM